MSDNQSTYRDLLDIYADQFTSGWQQALTNAAYKFRTTETVEVVTAGLADLAKLAADADALEGKIHGGDIDGKTAKTRSTQLDTLLAAKVTAVSKLVAGLAAIDKQRIARAAVVDQEALMQLRTKRVEPVDTTLANNLASFSAVVTQGLRAAEAEETGEEHAGGDGALAAAAKYLATLSPDVSKERVANQTRRSGMPMPADANPQSPTA